jgi:hypothetical protein
MVNCRVLPSRSTETHTRYLLHCARHSLHRYRLHRLELNAITDPEQRYRRLVELNVIEQCLNLFKTGLVQKRRVATYKEGGEYTKPQVHACVFDPNTGDMKRLMVSNSMPQGSAREGHCLSPLDMYSQSILFCSTITYRSSLWNSMMISTTFMIWSRSVTRT